MITFADVSEYQDGFDADAYLGGGYRVIIARAHNGNRKDRKWPARRDYIRTKRFAAVGYYQYIVEGRDVVSQARDFCLTVGKLALNEFVIGDLEEGSGDQTARADAWCKIVDDWAGFPATLYSGKSFIDDQLGGVKRWRDRPLWIASYLNSFQHDMANYPAGAEWWQYSDRERFPGLTGLVDANVFPGELEHFLPTVRPGGLPGGVVPREGEQSVAVATMKTGGQEVFVEATNGTVWHAWQRDAQWQPWVRLG